ncbi:Dihydropteridine reductase [Sarcoptes scabiei]|nr:Dihydropteridine reductase [Sarcoptes scabiei]
MSQNRVLVYGGKGALGQACVHLFKNHNWWVGSVDLAPNESAHSNVLVKNTDSLIAQETEVIEGVESILDGQKLDAIICVAGGWAGGSADKKDFIRNSDLMIKQSVWSSLLASKLASKYLKNNGLLTLTGAKAAMDSTPAVHHLTSSLASKKSGLPEGCTVVAIMPVTLDTPMNRKFMPKADFSSWTSLDFVADLFHKWSMSPSDRPKTGSLVEMVTENGQTQLTVRKNLSVE